MPVVSFVSQVLQVTNLLGVIPTYASEAEAIEAFSAGPAAPEKTPATRRTRIVCLDSSNDLLAYLKVLLTRAGYEVFTTRNPSDARTLVVATGPSVVIYGPGTQASESVIEKLRQGDPNLAVLVLPSDFSTAEASQAGTDLVERVRSALKNQV